MDIAQFAAPVRLGVTMPFFGKRKPEHVTLERHQARWLAGDEQHSGNEPDILRPF
ncbi:MAG: hypothetical protein ACYCO9_11875 [Streptosporangiaceae bacterium]